MRRIDAGTGMQALRCGSSCGALVHTTETRDSRSRAFTTMQACASALPPTHRLFGEVVLYPWRTETCDRRARELAPAIRIVAQRFNDIANRGLPKMTENARRKAAQRQLQPRHRTNQPAQRRRRRLQGGGTKTIRVLPSGSRGACDCRRHRLPPHAPMRSSTGGTSGYTCVFQSRLSRQS